MKVTRSQKICFGVLGVGLLALAADRSFGGAGGAVGASAADVSAEDARGDGARTVPGAGGATPVAAPIVVPGLAAKLRAIVPDDGLTATAPDAFKVPAVWSNLITKPVDVAPLSFKAAHALKAVLGGGRGGERGGRALLDDRLVEVGERVDGWELVEVRERHAVFAGPAGRVSLELPAPGDGR